MKLESSPMAYRPHQISLISVQLFSRYKMRRRVSIPSRLGWVGLGEVTDAHAQRIMRNGVIIPPHFDVKAFQGVILM
jgi:hypothetical protein